MLRWLLILAMALLPWHGWAGASPAGAPAAAQHHEVRAGTVLTPSDHENHHGQASADCLGDADAPADHHAAAGTDGGCPGCSMCHSCFPAGLPAMATVLDADAAPPLHPASAVSQFASADRDTGLKPPIS